MTTSTRLSFSLLFLASSACSGEFSETPDADDCQGQCDVIDPGACDDTRYGDGQCDLDLHCGPPDVDCFMTFSSDEEATHWFEALEQRLAEESLREPRRLLSAADPRYGRMRDLLDRGWKSYHETIPVAALAQARPGLVLIEDPEVNAFVAPDLDLVHVGFAVMVQTGLLDLGGSDDELLGLVMHELQHAIGLHTLPGRRGTFERYYAVQAGAPEPFGFEQANDPAVQARMEPILAAGRDVGLHPGAEWNGVPFPGSILFTVFQTAFAAGVQHDAAACADAQAGFELLGEFIQQHLRSLDSGFDLGEDADQLAYVTGGTVSALRDPCLAGSTSSFWDYLALQSGSTAEAARQSAPPEDQALADGRHVVDAVVALTQARFAKLDALGDRSSLRYYTTEEIADDVTVDVLAHAGLKPSGLADFLENALLSGGDQGACAEILAAGQVPPYGEDLVDDHHATCFRIWHLRALIAADKHPRPAEQRPIRPLTAPIHGARLEDLLSDQPRR